MGSPTNKQYWFKPKKYGWGWGMPANRKGWIAFGLFVAVWLAALTWLVSSASPDGDISTTNHLIFAVILITDVIGLVYVSFKHGEPPKWNWGSKQHGKSDKS